MGNSPSNSNSGKRPAWGGHMTPNGPVFGPNRPMQVTPQHSGPIPLPQQQGGIGRLNGDTGFKHNPNGPFSRMGNPTPAVSRGMGSPFGGPQHSQPMPFPQQQGGPDGNNSFRHNPNGPFSRMGQPAGPSQGMGSPFGGGQPGIDRQQFLDARENFFDQREDFRSMAPGAEKFAARDDFAAARDQFRDMRDQFRGQQQGPFGGMGRMPGPHPGFPAGAGPIPQSIEDLPPAAQARLRRSDPLPDYGSQAQNMAVPNWLQQLFQRRS